MTTEQLNLKSTAVFPGQGSQHVGMGKELYENFKVFKQAIEEASDSVGLNFKKLCLDGPEEDLKLTENTQPAIVACSAATFRVLETEFGYKPDAVAGHSVGEYAALVAAKVISLPDAIKAVRTRGKAMQEAVPVGMGAMAALLGPSDEQAVELCKWVESQNKKWVFEAANFNCPGQVVISGSAEAFEWLKENVDKFEFAPKVKKVKIIPLKVSAPFHCALMMPAQEVMKDFLSDVDFKTPTSHLIQNVTAEFTKDTSLIKKNMIEQVSGSVLWSKSVSNLSDAGVTTYTEVGSGSTLTGLIKKIDSKELQLFNSSTLENIKKVGEFLKQS
jgi:[acyl-carrier-protein] S-malonyltransferase